MMSFKLVEAVNDPQHGCSVAALAAAMLQQLEQSGAPLSLCDVCVEAIIIWQLYAQPVHAFLLMLVIWLSLCSCMPLILLLFALLRPFAP